MVKAAVPQMHLGTRKMKKGPPTSLLVPSRAVNATIPRSKLPLVQISASLFLSGYEPATNFHLLISSGVTHIINLVGQERCPNRFPGLFSYTTIAFRDATNTPIKKSLLLAIYSIQSALKQRGKVLVHCWCGISRGPTVICAYLMSEHHLSFEAAMQTVKAAQPAADPNLGFCAQLLQLEAQL